MKFHDTLNDKIWDLNTEDLIPEVKEKLEEISDAFIEFLEIPTDAVLDKVITGSSASYNYNEFSDLDLHIIVDYDKVHEDCPLVNGYLNSLKKQFNDNHDITIHGVPVELYAEQKDQGTVHNGLYSLQTGWIDKPQKIAPTDNDAAVEAKYNEIKELVDKCDDSEEATELLEKIYNMRKAGLAEAGEFCTENLAFKKLRNEGCMDKLRQIKKEQIDKQLSLESYNESLEQDVKELTKTDDYYKVDGSRVSIKNGFGSQIELMDLQNLGKKLEKKGYKVYCSNYYIDAKKNESIKESLQSEYKQAFDLLVEGTNQICLEDSDTVKEIMKKFDKLKTIKSDKLKLKKAKELLLDISGYMIDEKFDDYQKKIDKFMNNSKNESVNEENNCGWKKFGKNGEILKCGYYVAKIARQAVGNNYIATLNIKYKKQPLNMQTFEDKEEAKKWLENKLPKNESIKESEDELTLEDKLINILTKDGWNHLNGRGGEFLEKDNITIGLYVDSVIFNEFEDDEKELPLETEEDLQNILNQINELKKNESMKESKNYNENVDDIVIDNYLKMLLDNGHVVDTPDSQYVVQVFINKKLQKLVEFDDIRKAAETFIEFTDIYTRDEDVVLFKQMRDNGKDIKTIDSTWLNVSNKNESIKEGFNKGDKVQLKRKNNKIGIVKSIFNGDKDKNDKDIKYLDVEFEDGTKEGRPASDFKKVNESINKLEETLKKVEDMEINEGMWASPFTMENAKQVAEILSKPITYEELNSEEGKQKVWNIIGDDEFWDNVADEAFDNPEEDARYLIIKFLEDWMERKESFNDDAYSQEAENIIKKAIFMFNGITEDMATLEKKVDTADNDLHDIIASLENTMSEALKE